MRRSVVFVHGTGVRADFYVETLKRISAELTRRWPDMTVRGCPWGLSEGARAQLSGASIPGYARSGGGQGPSYADEELALWAVLYVDPWYELRLLGLAPASPSLPVAPRKLSPAQKFLAVVSTYTPSPELAAALRGHGLEKAFDEALLRVRRTPELKEAAQTVGAEGYEHRHAVARALIAQTLSGSQAEGADALDGRARDALLALVSSELHTQGRSLTGRLKHAATAPALHALTWQARRRRGTLSDGSLPASGDILRYQARGDGIRRLIRRTVEDTPGDAVTLIGHSLGGVACVDLLALEPVPRVDQLITVGSQSGFLYEIGALVSLEPPEPLPVHFPRQWLNIYDQRDLLSYLAAPVFRDRVQDCEVDNRQPFPQAHGAYWTNKDVWETVHKWLH